MTRNLSSSTPSIDACINNANLYGTWPVGYIGAVAVATTAANTTSGYVAGQKFLPTIPVPAVGTGIEGYVITMCDMVQLTSGVVSVCVNETLLGTLTVSGNVFADGSAMPSKTVRGSLVQTASQLAILVVDTNMTATTPVVTITYTDQGGNTNQTATLTLPSTAKAQSTFLINSHLASGDTGIQDITNISISTGSAGVIKIYGCLILGVSVQGTTPQQSLEPFSAPMVQWVNQANDTIAFYGFGSNAVADLYACLAGTPETT